MVLNVASGRYYKCPYKQLTGDTVYMDRENFDIKFMYDGVALRATEGGM